MSDNKLKKGYQDDSKIAKDELSDWAKSLNVSIKILKCAISETKSHAVSKVKAWLIKNRYIDNKIMP